MGKVAEIIESTWQKMTLYAESIPHFFHWDLAYFWILEREPDLRPEGWKERIEAWHHLISLFFAGELEINKESVTEPFVKYTQPYGLNDIFWVSPRNTDKKIATLSSTVLVRPLPDFKAEDRKKWPPCPEKIDPIVSHFIHLAIKELERKDPQESYIYRIKLANILGREFKESKLMAEAPIGRSVSVPSLCKMSWAQSPSELCVLEVKILIRELKGVGFKVYVPRCKICNSILTKLQKEDPITTVEQDKFQIKCEKNHVNDLDLNDFLIWHREEKKQVVVWDREGVFSNFGKGFPPEPIITGIEVNFEWNAAQLEGEPDKRFLKLKFPDKQVIRQRVGDIFFKKILVPGDFEKFSGLPIREEWIDVLSNPEEIKPEVEKVPVKVTYRKMRLKGWPVTIDWVFSEFSLHLEKNLAVAIYPDPDILPEEWHWYRVFLHGSKRRDYQVEIENGKEIFRWLVEVDESIPDSFSVKSRSNKDIGTTFYRKGHKELGKAIPAEICLGIDFGTSNSIIYFLPPGKEFKEIENDAANYCVKPSEFFTAAHWLAKSADSLLYTIGDFLPNSNYREARGDSYIIPSALWQFNGKFLIRWGSDKPIESASPLTGFKSDSPGVDYSPHRKAFIKEILLLALPLIIKKGTEANAITTWDLRFNLGFAFPLAFGHDDRNKMSALFHDDILRELNRLTSFNYESFSVNESSACIKLLGSPDSTDTFFVADMGGGTLDLGLFTSNIPKPDQIGSVRFAGENYLDSLGRKRNVDIWKFRDLIAEDKCHKEYGKDQISQVMLSKFVGMGFELLRTMIEAYRRNKPDQKIYLVLAGNGWHLVEAFSEQTDGIGAQRVFQSYYDHILSLLNDKDLELTKLSQKFTNLRNLKHLVAIGALKHVHYRDKDSRTQELDSEKPIAKLPAGRGLKFSKPGVEGKKIVKWYELIGGRVPFKISNAEELLRLDLEFDFNDMPVLRGDWKSYILDLFGVSEETNIPYPDKLSLREDIRHSISGLPPQLSKGPLQLILERYWISLLRQ